jgi:hypothetical protein
MTKDVVRIELEKYLKKASSIDGFTLLFYADRALDELADEELAKKFVEASEKAIGERDPSEMAHPCDLGAKIYALFKDRDRAERAFRACLDACGWDSSSVKSAEKDWLKICKKFK